MEPDGVQQRDSLEASVAVRRPSYVTVTERYQRALIVCSGPSAELGSWQRLLPGFIAAGGAVIAVNGSVEWLDHCTHWCSIDPGVTNRRVMNNRRAGVSYYAAVPEDYGHPHARWHCHRQPAETGILFLHRSERAEIQSDPGWLSTGNSGYGALNLALHFGCRRVAFVGLDGDKLPYAHARRRTRPVGRMCHLPGLFQSALPALEQAGCQVINGSRFSRVTCFARTMPDAAMEWICDV